MASVRLTAVQVVVYGREEVTMGMGLRRDRCGRETVGEEQVWAWGRGRGRKARDGPRRYQDRSNTERAQLHSGTESVFVLLATNRIHFVA